MKKLNNFAKNFWTDESGQGTAEYVLLIAIVVGLVIMFKDSIKKLIGDKLGDISNGFSQVN